MIPLIRLFLITFLLLVIPACTNQPTLPVLGEVGNFSLTERSGSVITSEDLKGEVWVANFIFTRCGGPCPRMTAELASFQKKIGPRPGLQWVSFTVDPTVDTPELLTSYANKYGADPQSWLFLTGELEPLYNLIKNGFKLGVGPAPNPDELIVHSTKIVLVDKQGKIRSYLSHFEDTTLGTLQKQIDTLLAE